MSTILHILLKIVWAFWALGPQLALCLWFAYSLARRRHESRLNWMIGGFMASLVPVAGAVAMYLLWRPGAPVVTARQQCGDRPAPDTHNARR